MRKLVTLERANIHANLTKRIDKVKNINLYRNVYKTDRLI